MATLENKTEQHLLEYFGKTSEVLLNFDDYLDTNSCFDYRIMNSIFSKMYVKLFTLDSTLNDNYDIATDELRNKLNKMNEVNNYYTIVRRIKKEIEKYLEVNIVNEFNTVSILNKLSKDLSEYKLIKNVRIKNADYKIKEKIDTNRYLGDTSPVKNIYVINKIDPINEYPSITLVYEFNGEASFNIFQTKFIAEKYEIYSINIISEGEIITPKYTVEKLRDNICLIFDESVNASEIEITYYIVTKSKLDKTASFTIGDTIYSNKLPYSDLEEYQLDTSTTLNKFILDNVGLEKFNYVITHKYNYSLPSVNIENKRYVNRMYMVTSYNDISISLLPLPMSSSIKLYYDEYLTKEIDVTSKIIGNSIILTTEDFKLYNINIGTKLYIKYETDDIINKYYTKNNIQNKLIYNTSNDKITSFTDGSSGFNNVVSYPIEEYFFRKKNIVRDNKQVEIIQYKRDDTSDYRDVVRTQNSQNLYFYKEEYASIGIDRFGSITLILKEQYLPGSLVVLNDQYSDQIVIKSRDWVDMNYDPSTDKDKLEITIDNPKLINYVKVYYIPLTMSSSDLDVITNINNVKTNKINTKIVNGECTISLAGVHIDKYITKEWTKDGNIYKHPIYQYIYYEPFSSKYDINEIEINENSATIKFIDSSLNDDYGYIMTFSNTVTSQININYKYILPESNPVIIME